MKQDSITKQTNNLKIYLLKERRENMKLYGKTTQNKTKGISC